MNLTDYAWAAGFLDGEGYIGVQRKRPTYGIRKSGPNIGRPRRDATSYQLVVLAVQINPDPIDRLVAIFGGVKTRCRRSGRGKSDYWRWRIGSAAACSALQAMLPFFVGKREVATTCVSFQTFWQASYPATGRSMSPERRAGAAWYHLECQRLNRRYRNVPEGRTESLPANAEGLLLAVGSETGR